MAPLVTGHTYRLELSTLFDTAILTVALQKTIANFDNIRLRVKDGTSTFGAPIAVTDDATNIGLTTATLNGRTNANGIPSTYDFRISTDKAAVATHRPGAGGRSVQRRHRDDVPGALTHATGLTGCTTYWFRIDGRQLGGLGRRLDAVVQDGVQARRGDAGRRDRRTAATFNAAINPSSLATKVCYEYGTRPAARSAAHPGAQPGVVIGSEQSTTSRPNSVPDDGLTKRRSTRSVPSPTTGAARRPGTR